MVLGMAHQKEVKTVDQKVRLTEAKKAQSWDHEMVLGMAHQKATRMVDLKELMRALRMVDQKVLSLVRPMERSLVAKMERLTACLLSWNMRY